jgi:hypothetical protein
MNTSSTNARDTLRYDSPSFPNDSKQKKMCKHQGADPFHIGLILNSSISARRSPSCPNGACGARSATESQEKCTSH